MKTHNKNHSDFIVSSYPVEVTVGELKAWISRNDVASKENLVEFIHNRLNYRYIQPLLHVVPAEKKSGFLMMGSACLMIETLESFYDGKMAGRHSRDFLKEKSVFFLDLKTMQ
jgi:hypothetical protein